MKNQGKSGKVECVLLAPEPLSEGKKNPIISVPEMTFGTSGIITIKYVVSVC